MKSADLIKKTKVELEKLLREEREHLRDLQLDLALGKIKNVREIQKTKKDIARILTILKSNQQSVTRNE